MMRRDVRDRDWTQGSVVRNLVTLAWPMVITQALNTAGPIIDMIWVGKLGAAAIAGVGISTMAVQLINSFMMGLTMGMRAMVARFVGAGDPDSANHAARQTFIISAAFALIMAVIGMFLAESILIGFGVEPDVVSEGAAYMRIMFVGSMAMSFRVVTESIMQSSGDTVTPMRIAIFYRLFHVGLAPVLIFGLWVFPKLGVSGAAITNVVSQSLGLGIGLWILFTGRTRLRLTLKNFRIDTGIIWRIIKIALPASVMGMERTFAQLMIMRIVVPFGTLAVAAQTLAQRVEIMFLGPSMSVGTASGVLGGQNLGAGHPERAEKSAWTAIVFAETIILLATVAILLGAEGIVGIFTSDPGIIEIASNFIRIATVGYLTLGLVVVLMQFLSGVGDTLPPMLITLIGMWMFEIPLAFFLSRLDALGVYGVRWASVTSMILRALAYFTYFRVGRWKRKVV